MVSALICSSVTIASNHNGPMRLTWKGMSPRSSSTRMAVNRCALLYVNGVRTGLLIGVDQVVGANDGDEADGFLLRNGGHSFESRA